MLICCECFDEFSDGTIGDICPNCKNGIIVEDNREFDAESAYLDDAIEDDAIEDDTDSDDGMPTDNHEDDI